MPTISSFYEIQEMSSRVQPNQDMFDEGKNEPSSIYSRMGDHPRAHLGPPGGNRGSMQSPHPMGLPLPDQSVFNESGSHWAQVVRPRNLNDGVSRAQPWINPDDMKEAARLLITVLVEVPTNRLESEITDLKCGGQIEIADIMTMMYNLKAGLHADYMQDRRIVIEEQDLKMAVLANFVHDDMFAFPGGRSEHYMSAFRVAIIRIYGEDSDVAAVLTGTPEFESDADEGLFYMSDADNSYPMVTPTIGA